ncbi:hypothetical protein TKK_0002820 [Trichogramma kaykai]|uniref:Major facilitator superfamily (MFS) profile domain-containing protein n=1 Tax=Trichogramma kaykai TaxID=54128 RepID=A0ABD2XUP0_9HYME
MIQVAKKTTLQKYFPQLVAGLGVTMVLVQLGLSSGWSSPYLPKLQHPDSALRLTADEASWVASLLNLGRFCGAFCGALAVNYCGTKRTMLFNLIPVSMCWLLTILARDARWLYAARFSGGLGLGMTYSSFPLYLGEVSFPEIRGSLVSMASCGGTFGVMLSNIAGKYLAMEVSASIYLAPCLVFIALFWWLPESPHYLIKKKDFKAAKASISWYRADHNVEEEFESVQQFINAAKEQSFTEKLAEFKKPAIRRATILVILLWTFMQICGFNNVLFYMVQILQDSKVNNPEDFAMYVSAAGVAASTLSIVMIDRCGRRWLLIVSSIGVSVGLAGLGAHFLLLDQEETFPNLHWLPIISLFVFEIAFFVGLMSVPSAVLSEIFPSNVKCIAACFASLAGAIAAFASTRSFQPFIGLMGTSNVFFMHAGITLLIVPYAIIFMPETKGKTLQQIQELLTRR